MGPPRVGTVPEFPAFFCGFRSGRPCPCRFSGQNPGTDGEGYNGITGGPSGWAERPPARMDRMRSCAIFQPVPDPLLCHDRGKRCAGDAASAGAAASPGLSLSHTGSAPFSVSLRGVYGDPAQVSDPGRAGGFGGHHAVSFRRYNRGRGPALNRIISAHNKRVTTCGRSRAFGFYT